MRLPRPTHVGQNLSWHASHSLMTSPGRVLAYVVQSFLLAIDWSVLRSLKFRIVDHSVFVSIESRESPEPAPETRLS